MVHLFSPNSTQRLYRSEGHNSRHRLIARLIIGLVQGLALYGLYRVTKNHNDLVGFLATWALVAGYVPVVALAAIGQLNLRTALIWTGLVTILLAALGFSSGFLPDRYDNFPTMVLCLPAALFCAHHIVIPGLRHGQALAPYDDYYETAWKAGIQLVLALMFLGVFWLILFLGAALFKAIGVGIVEDIISNQPFAIIASSLLFALGVELSDVRDGLTQGIRTVALTLLSWLMPVAVLLAGAFVIALPLTGLSSLQTSLSPSALMLSASAGLIVLINTTYQDGREHLSDSAFLRATLRVACVLLLPMTAFALWAISVRIGQHGLTVARIAALTSAVIGFIYAVGYLLAQFLGRNKGKGWLPVLEGTNVLAGIITTLILIGFSTPWLNPQQLSAENQIARIQSGRIAPEDIPYEWLAYGAGERGYDMLDTLSRSDNPEIARHAREHIAKQSGAAQAFKLTLLPSDTPMPEGFEAMIRDKALAGQCHSAEGCVARLYDIDADGTSEVLLALFNTIHVYGRDSEGQWKLLGQFHTGSQCDGDLPKSLFTDNAPKPRPHSGPQPIELAGNVLKFTPEETCEP